VVRHFLLSLSTTVTAAAAVAIAIVATTLYSVRLLEARGSRWRKGCWGDIFSKQFQTFFLQESSFLYVTVLRRL
jgi:hypothetical protein